MCLLFGLMGFKKLLPVLTGLRFLFPGLMGWDTPYPNPNSHDNGDQRLIQNAKRCEKVVNLEKQLPGTALLQNTQTIRSIQEGDTSNGPYIRQPHLSNPRRPRVFCGNYSKFGHYSWDCLGLQFIGKTYTTFASNKVGRLVTSRR